ncbi:MAG: hypothetical protein JWQ09_5835 [Segetibacter sp.]|nr:hypothetical protein [Segetibacter sp.]
METIKEVIQEAASPITFELAIIDEKEPVKLTAELIREKSKALTDLKIISIFDEAGYKAVKAATMKAVRTRTSIEKKEKEVLDAMKLRHASEKKEVTDYTSELYTACREAQTALENKMKVVDEEKAAAAKKLADDLRAKTEARDNRLFELGMTWNGQSFVGYGKNISKDVLYSLTNEGFDKYTEELEGLQMEQAVTGKEDAPVITMPTPPVQNGTMPKTFNAVTLEKPLFENAIYERYIGAYTLYLTKGEVAAISGQIVTNDRVMNSGIYVQVVR